MVDELFEVEVAYALPEQQPVVKLQVAPGTTVRDAVLRSGLVERFPEINPETVKLGIFGRLAKGDATLGPGDRVEIYRPLIADPKEARKKRAAEGKQMKKGGGAAPADTAKG